jgi:hypothetical protein
VFGSLPVDQVQTPEVLKALSPIWLKKPETARRVRQRIKTVFDKKLYVCHDLISISNVILDRDTTSLHIK